MWLCLNNAFLSIVQKECGPDQVLVRARRKGDIEAVFPDAKVTERLHTDYRYRAVVGKQALAHAMMGVIESLDYDNFKDSVKDRRLHDAYARVWHVMAALQPSRPYSRPNPRKQRDLLS